jgi:hypothetical protein
VIDRHAEGEGAYAERQQGGASRDHVTGQSPGPVTELGLRSLHGTSTGPRTTKQASALRNSATVRQPRPQPIFGVTGDGRVRDQPALHVARSDCASGDRNRLTHAPRRTGAMAVMVTT